MLVRGRISRLPGHNEVRYIPGGVAPPPPRKAKATMKCKAPVVCLVTVHVSCLYIAAVQGGNPPAPPPAPPRTPPPRAPVVYLVTVPVSYLDTAAMLIVRPDSPALQAILIFADAPFNCFRKYGIGQRRAGSGTDLLPPRAQRSEIYCRRCCPPPPPRKAKVTMNCRASVVCLVTVPVSCLDTAAVPGGGNPPDPSLEHATWCWVTDFVSCLDTAAVQPPPDPPSNTPPDAGSQIYLPIFLKKHAQQVEND